MKRREFVAALGSAAISLPLDAWAQRTVPTIGVLSPFNDAESTLLADFGAGLREYGYVDGQNLRIEYRSAEGRLELLPDLISDLLSRNGTSEMLDMLAAEVAKKTRDPYSAVEELVQRPAR